MMNDVILGNCTPTGYNFLHKARDGKAGGGVGLLFKSTFSMKMESTASFKSFEALQANVSSNSHSLKLIVIYRPENVEYGGQRIPFSLFLEEFASLLDTFVLHPSEVILTGDFNIWVDDLNDPRTRQFMNLLSTYGMKQHVTEKTHIHGHTLDLLITRDSNNTLSDVSVVPGISDHYAVHCSLDLERPPPARKTVTTRPLRTMDSEQFRTGALESLSAINFKTDSITSCVESYNNSLSELIDRLAPQKTRSVVVKPSSPWMTEDIHAAKCLKRRLERKWRRTKSDYDRKAYTKQRQVVSSMIEHSKTEYYSQCVSECVGNQKRLFTITDRLMHRKKEPVLPDTTCDLQLAEKFSQFYSDKIIKIREDIDKQDVIQTTYIQSKPTSPTPGLMDFVPTSVAEVRRIIMSSPTSSCELDPIPTGLVKEHVDDFAPYITGIVNKSLRDATFPDSMCHGCDIFWITI